MCNLIWRLFCILGHPSGDDSFANVFLSKKKDPREINSREDSFLGASQNLKYANLASIRRQVATLFFL